MRHLFLVTVITTCVLLMSFSFNDPLPIGSSLPKSDLKLKDVSGKEITVKEIKQQHGVLVMFSCNTCPYVVKNQARTQAICDYALKAGVGVILLNSNEGNRDDADSYASMQQYARDQQYKWIYAVDENNVMADALGAKRTPECFLFDKDLKLAYHGAIDNNPADADNVSRKHLQLAIDEMVSGKAVTINDTKSVGCGIKRAN